MNNTYYKLTAKFFSSKDVTKWILEKSVPLVWEFDQNTGAKIFASKIKVHFLYFINEAESAEAKKAIAPLKDVAAVHKDDIIFVTVNAAVASNKGVLEFFGLGDLDLPTYGIYEVINFVKLVLKF